MNSLPNRSSISPFRKSVNFNTLDNRSTTKNKKRQSLKIITSPDEQEQQHEIETATKSPSSVRQRLSSLFRTSSPVVMTLKETFNNKRASSTVSFFSSPLTEEETTATTRTSQHMEPMDDSHSTTTTLSSDSSDHMPASPADARTIFSSANAQQTIWQPSVTILSYEDEKVTPSSTIEAVKEKEKKEEKTPQFAITRTSSSLAFQVHQILGSTLDEVDEEIDQDWENRRNVLHQSLVSTGDRRNLHFRF